MRARTETPRGSSARTDRARRAPESPTPRRGSARTAHCRRRSSGRTPSARELVGDPVVRFGRLDATRKADLVGKELACLQVELTLAEREPGRARRLVDRAV